jgi:hypothetical protein
MKSGEKNRAATAGDRRSDSPERLPTRRTATADEVLTELANDPVGGASNTDFSLMHLGDRVHWESNREARNEYFSF